jgi:hypothetical protein
MPRPTPRILATAIAAATMVVVGVSANGTAGHADGGGPYRVPEAQAYRVVYRLPIPVEATGFQTGTVPYDVDDSAGVTGYFDRVAYYLELNGANGDLQWVYVSADAFTATARHLGVPTLSSGAFFQRELTDMTVASNVAGIVTGDHLTGGNLEFWPHNYSPGNGAGIPGASTEVYDFGDTPADPAAGYGSMQVHNYEARQTLFAYNRWGAGGASDLGIGNSSPEHTDWTFRANAGDFLTRTLYVLVREAAEPPVRLDGPPPRAVFQRDANGVAAVPVTGRCARDVTRIEARAVPMPGDPGRPTPWRVVDAAPRGGRFSGRLVLGGGWFRIEVRGLDGDRAVSTASVARIGVGEVFVTAGQSNSANHGWPPLAPDDDRVSALGPSGWRHAGDPQPIATGSGGTPWPPFGDALASALDVPVGLVSVGWGGTSVEQWLPGGTLYPRLAEALSALGPNGARAVLWHQGESDAALGTSRDDYAARLTTIIEASRRDAGHEIPWGIARVGFGPGFAPERIAEVVAGQDLVIARVAGAFAGPTTDDLVGEEWRHDGIHFNERGLREHGHRWAACVLAGLTFPPPPPALTRGTLLLVPLAFAGAEP